MKALEAFRLYGYFPVAMDGSQICTFDSEPWPNCPHRKLSDGSLQYFAYVLDAKLLTACGMALSLAELQADNQRRANLENGTQAMRWVHQLPIAEFTPNVLFCREKLKDKAATLFAWLTPCHSPARSASNPHNRTARCGLPLVAATTQYPQAS